jgi:5-methylcytosine-specific restriction protein B
VAQIWIGADSDDFSGLTMQWFRDIVETEVVPLLEEYWYELPDRVITAAAALLAA